MIYIDALACTDLFNLIIQIMIYIYMYMNNIFDVWK